MADITIDGKKYDASDMNEDQKNLVQKLAQIEKQKNPDTVSRTKEF